MTRLVITKDRSENGLEFFVLNFVEDSGRTFGVMRVDSISVDPKAADDLITAMSSVGGRIVTV